MTGLSRETENTITPAQEKLCHTSGRRAEKPDGKKSLQMRNWKKIYGWQGKQQLGKGLGTPAGGSVGDLCALCLSHGGGLKTVSEDNTLLQEEKTPTSSPFIMCRYPMKVFHCLLEGKTVNVICWERSRKLSEGSEPWKRSWSWSYLPGSSINATSSWTTARQSSTAHLHLLQPHS